MKKRLLLVYLIAFLAIAGAALYGRAGMIDLAAALSDSGEDSLVLFQFRLPRVLIALVVGATLAASGLLLQAILQNPLASPFTLGANAGASLAVMLVIFATGGSVFLWHLAPAALLGCLLLTLPLVIVAARKGVPAEAVLLGGVAISFGASAITTAATAWAPSATMMSFIRWSFGSVADIGYNKLWWLIPMCVPVTLWTIAKRTRLDAMLAGDELAIARGVNLRAIRAISIALVALAIGGIVAVCGPISFIGLMVPHMARAIVGSSPRELALAVPGLGAATLVISDWLGANAFESFQMPIGVVTAALGTPAFLVLLIVRFRR